MGVDPGLAATGYGCLETRPGRVAVVDAGVISTPADERLEARLQEIHDGVRNLLEKHAPTLLVVEDLYAEYKFPRTAILMGHARGVIYLAAAERGVAVLALAPAEVKRAITANGAATKAQVQRGVQARLGLPEAPRPSHVADSLSLALIGLSRVLGRL
jgi:crossover junction endodeoxyribonuclease RuvC